MAGLTRSDLRRILREPNPLASLRHLAFPEWRPPTEAFCAPATLWVIDAQGLPMRPAMLTTRTTFRCVALNCDGMTAGVCSARQATSEAQRVNWRAGRGRAPDYPHCVTETCAQGRAIRNALDPERTIRFHGSGPGGRFARDRSDLAQQHASRKRMERAGLLGDVPTLDEEPVGVEMRDNGTEASGSEQPEARRETAGRQRQSVPARGVREPRREAEGSGRVPRDGSRKGDRSGDALPPVGRREGRHPGGGDPSGLRVGSTRAGGRGEREGRRAGRGVGCP